MILRSVLLNLNESISCDREFLKTGRQELATKVCCMLQTAKLGNCRLEALFDAAATVRASELRVSHSGVLVHLAEQILHVDQMQLTS